jgi:hypothetical protein
MSAIKRITSRDEVSVDRPGGERSLTISCEIVSYHSMDAYSTERLTWWSSFCGRPDTTTAPMGVRSHPLIQIGMAGRSERCDRCNTARMPIVRG